ncbi:MAG: F0F1 ATP synthase subunit epsilon [Amphiplicatus sp.]
MPPRLEMHLKVTTPASMIIDERALKIIAEATNGSFALLPRHVDFVAPLVAGVLAYEAIDGKERFLGVDEGFLVKCGGSVHISTRRAVKAPNLEKLRECIDSEFRTRNAQDVAARSALARLEIGLIRRFVELEQQ